jgi:alpha-glucosidase
MTLLDSHDTARFADAAATRDHHVVGLVLLFTMPGVPMVFAGDEVGLRGRDSDAARRPFPWDENRWDTHLLAAFARLAALRRATPALQRGGLRFLDAGEDSITFAREMPGERVLVHVARAAHEPVAVPAAVLGGPAPLEVLFGSHRPVVDGERIVLPAAGPAATICRIGPTGPDQ